MCVLQLVKPDEYAAISPVPFVFKTLLLGGGGGD